MIRAIYAGSFDPVTKGHLDVIVRASRIVDELVVGVLNNRAKTPLFSVEERVKMLEEVTKEYPDSLLYGTSGRFCEGMRSPYYRARPAGDHGLRL